MVAGLNGHKSARSLLHRWFDKHNVEPQHARSLVGLEDGSETHGVAFCGLSCQHVLCQNLRFIVAFEASS